MLALTSFQLLMFRSIIKNDISSLKTLCTSLAKIHPPSVALLRCLNHLSAQPQEVKSMTVFQMHSHLTYLQLYATRYRGLTRTRGLEASALAQRLFGFSLDKSGVEATVLLTSFISHQTDSPLRRIRINGQDQPVVDAKTLGTWIIRCVEDHMISVLHNHAIACLDANSFAPLCPHYLDGRIGCSCSRHHVRKDCVATFYNVQLCLYLKQIEVLNCAEPRTRRRDQRKYVPFSLPISYLIVLSAFIFAASLMSSSHLTNLPEISPALRDRIQAPYKRLQCYEAGSMKVHSTWMLDIQPLCSKRSSWQAHWMPRSARISDGVVRFVGHSRSTTAIEWTWRTISSRFSWI